MLLLVSYTCDYFCNGILFFCFFSVHMIFGVFLGICYSEDSAEIVESGAISLSMSESAVGRSFQQ